MIVIDANIALKWFIPESGMSAALSILRAQKKLIAPHIVRGEVISGLVRRVRREELSSGEASDAIQEWLRELGRETVHLIEDETLLTEAAELGFTIKNPFFDCMYLALAIRLDVPLFTADRPFFEHAKSIYENTYWLADADALVKEIVDAGTND